MGDVVEIFWIDFVGSEVSYGQVNPGEALQICTGTTHPWLVRRVSDNTPLMGFISNIPGICTS